MSNKIPWVTAATLTACFLILWIYNDTPLWSGIANSKLFLELIKGMFVLLAVAAGAAIGLRMYFRQKEHELLLERYLVGAVDLLAAEVGEALGIVRHNWARCLQIVKAYRDGREDFDIKELDKGFLPLDSSKFHLAPLDRIARLTETPHIRVVYQHAMAYATYTDSAFTKEFPTMLRLEIQTDKIKGGREFIADALLKESKKQFDDGLKYEQLISVLHGLGVLLEKERLNSKVIEQFSLRKDVKDLLEELESAFPDEFSALREAQKKMEREAGTDEAGPQP